jgi:hypothetical protein
MRQIPHFPSEIPDEPLFLRRMNLPPDGGPRRDEFVPLDWMVTAATADAFLRDDLKRSGAHGVRIETQDGGFIRALTVWDVGRATQTLALGAIALRPWPEL